MAIVSQAEVLPASVERLLKRDIASMALLDLSSLRYVVDVYYSLQDYRIQAANQVRASEASGEPHALLRWLFSQMEAMEASIKTALDVYTDVEPSGMGKWAKAVVGIGPVLSAGLLAHIDIERAPTAGHIWSFAGLNPEQRWAKGEKRPWNARLKTLCWKIGESFVKVSGNPAAQYGKLYAQRKQRELEMNLQGAFAEQAAAILAAKKIGKDTDAYRAYSQGMLPAAHVHARAKRWAVKLFLAHYWEEAYRRHYRTEPPAPYPIAFLGHAHVISHEERENHRR
jgi:Transposase IS116/IS110/IS902 family